MGADGGVAVLIRDAISILTSYLSSFSLVSDAISVEPNDNKTEQFAMFPQKNNDCNRYVSNVYVIIASLAYVASFYR